MNRRFNVISDGLFLGSNPIPCKEMTRIDHVEDKRVLCRRYENCLTYAAANHWEGFHCQDCIIEEPLPVADQYSDLEGLAFLLYAIDIRK